MAGQISKKDADYRLGAPHCGICKFYSEDEKTDTGACKLVAGSIDEDMGCRLFQSARRPTLAESR